MLPLADIFWWISASHSGLWVLFSLVLPQLACDFFWLFFFVQSCFNTYGSWYNIYSNTCSQSWNNQGTPSTGLKFSKQLTIFVNRFLVLNDEHSPECKLYENRIGLTGLVDLPLLRTTSEIVMCWAGPKAHPSPACLSPAQPSPLAGLCWEAT